MTIPVLWPWQGSKVRLAPFIVSRLPPHQRYVEPFAGTAAVLLAKPRAPIEVLNDRNQDLVAVYRCLQDPVLTRRLYRRVQWTPVSRAEWLRAQEPLTSPDLVEQAARFLVRMTQSFNGLPGRKAWGGGLGPIVPRIDRTLRRFAPVADRLRGVALECAPWDAVVARCESPETLFFVDPPYRTDHEDAETAYDATAPWTVADWDALLTWALGSPAMIVLTHYPHPDLHRLADAGWHHETLSVWVNAKARTRRLGIADGHLDAEHDRRDEQIWWSPRAWDRVMHQLTLWDFVSDGPDAEDLG